MTVPAPSHVTHQTWKHEVIAHLPLSEQYETIQNQARLEALAHESKHPMQMVTLAERTPNDITQVMYPFLKEF